MLTSKGAEEVPKSPAAGSAGIQAIGGAPKSGRSGGSGGRGQGGGEAQTTSGGKSATVAPPTVEGGRGGTAGKPISIVLSETASGGTASGGTASGGTASGGTASGGTASGGKAGASSVSRGGTSPITSINVGGCRALTYPNGTVLETVPNAAFTAEYKAFETTDCKAPQCFIDVLNLKSPDGKKFDIHVKIAENFELYELVADNVDPKKTGDVDPEYAYSTLVLVDVGLVEQLEALRDEQGGPVNLNSGFRAPKYQHTLCHSLCNADECKDSSGATTCARSSKHMWGTAADMSTAYQTAARKVQFEFVDVENGSGDTPHLHVDMRKCQ